VTVETAVAFPVVVALLLAGLTGITAVSTMLRCVDAAREAARVAARGGPGEAGGAGGAGMAAGQRAAPDGAVVSVRVEGDNVRAVVRMRVRPLVPLLPSFSVEGSAVAAVEPGGGPA
jgi:Flp pilus assembly protein TadG